MCYDARRMKLTSIISMAACAFGSIISMVKAADERPNILFIISDDHAVQALGTCEKDSPVPLPGFRRMAQEGMVFDRAYCANSLCGPSRACMLTGRHSHNNGFLYNYGGPAFNGAQPTYPKMLQTAGYQTGIVGKWHLISQPTGFDSWQVFVSQGEYWNPHFLSLGPKGGTIGHTERGYVSDLLTSKAIDWIENRDKSKPFALILGHKAPHRNWVTAPRHLQKVKEEVAKMTPPSTIDDTWSDIPEFFGQGRQTVGWDLCNWNDSHLNQDLIPFEVMKEIVPKWKLRQMVNNGRFKDEIPADFDWNAFEPKYATKTNYGWDLNGIDPGMRCIYKDFFDTRTREFVEAFKSGKIQNQHDMTVQRWRWYMEDYLGTIMGVDESINDILTYLDKKGLSEKTLVIYVGDQGFYTGEHGWYDKRHIFEQSLRMPLIMRWKGHIPAGVRSNAMVQNIDYAPTIVQLAEADNSKNVATFDGVSLVPLLKTGEAPEFTDRALYYAFYEQPGEHNAPRHDGVRTSRYTFAHIWTPTPEERKSGQRKPSNEWLLIDNEKDPDQLHNVSQDPAYAEVMKELTEKYYELRKQYRVKDDCPGSGNKIPDFIPSWGPGEKDHL